MTENANDAVIKHYNRDILLQLRLHPLSLQKPRELPEMEVVKDKVYVTVFDVSAVNLYFYIYSTTL